VSKTLGKNKIRSNNSSAKTSASSLDSGDNSSKTEDYLNSILPPNEYEKNGQLWL